MCVMRGESKTYTTCVLHEQSATISYICQGMSNICGYAKSVMMQVAIFKLQQIFLSLSSSFAFNSPQGWALKHLIEALLYFSVFCSFVHVFFLLLITVSNSLLLMICCEHLYFFYLPCIPEDGLCFIDRLFTSVLNDVPSSTHVYR